METEREFNKDRAYLGVLTESSGEYVLPDYNGDVKKILTTRARANPSGKFLGSDSAEFAGIVAYDVVYLDSENNVTGISFTTDYDFAVKCSGEDYVDAGVRTDVSAYGIRLIGPRKISAKATLSSDVHIVERDRIDITGDAFTEEEPEVGEERVNIRCSAFGKSEEREYAEELVKIDGAIADEVEVLLVDTDSVVNSADIQDANAIVKGSVTVKALIKNGEGIPYTVTKSIPVSHNVPITAGEDGYITARIGVPSHRCEVNPTEEGVTLTLSIITDAFVRVQSNTQMPVVTDAYVKTRGCENQYSDFNYTTLVNVAAASEKMSFDLSRESLELEDIREIITADATPIIECVEGVDGGVKISGELRFSGIACEVKEDGAVGYSCIKFPVPFEMTVNNNIQNNSNMRYEAELSVSGVSVEVDSARIYPSATLWASVGCLEDGRVARLASSILTEEVYVKSASSITVYYPEAGDTLFEVAKKYHTSVLSVAADNSLAEGAMLTPTSRGSLAGVKKLIIR